MSLIVADRVKESSSTIGTGPFQLIGAVAGYRPFASGIGIGNSTYYGALSGDGTNWEVGNGTVSAGSLSRDSVLSSSAANNALISLTGISVVWCDMPASALQAIFALGYQYAQPTTGTTVAMAAGSGRLILDPAGRLASLTVQLPPAPVLDGAVSRISTSQTIDSLTITPSAGQTVAGGGPFVLAANGGVSFVYRGSNAKWYPG